MKLSNKHTKKSKSSQRRNMQDTPEKLISQTLQAQTAAKIFWKAPLQKLPKGRPFCRNGSFRRNEYRRSYILALKVSVGSTQEYHILQVGWCEKVFVTWRPARSQHSKVRWSWAQTNQKIQTSLYWPQTSQDSHRIISSACSRRSEKASWAYS